MIKTITTTERYENGELVEKIIEEQTDDDPKPFQYVFPNVTGDCKSVYL